MIRNLRALSQLAIDSRRSPRALQELISKRLKRVLCHAYQHTDFYRERMDAAGFRPARDYVDPSALRALPITTKADLKTTEKRKLICHGELDNLSNYFHDHTSGTTGIPIEIHRNEHERAIQMAKWMWVLIQNGYRPTQRVYSFTSAGRLNEGKSILQRFGLLRRLAVDNTLTPAEHLESWRRYRPHFVYGIRSAYDLMALEALRQGAEIPKPAALLVGGETIYENTRKFYRDAYGLEPTVTYGSVELGVMAYETPAHDGLHLMNSCTHFEFLDADGNPATPGEPARVIGTDLAGLLMPLIRYEQGDRVIHEVKEGPSGIPIVHILQVMGREDDYARLPNGDVVTFNTFYEATSDFDELRQFRVIQRQLDRFELQLVADPIYYDSLRKRLLERLRSAIPGDIHFDLKRLDEIPAEPNGKVRMLISEVGTSAADFAARQTD